MKYKLIKIDNAYRVKALKDFGNIKEGEVGGIVFDKRCLSQEGNCWIDFSSTCSSISRIIGDSLISNSHIIGRVLIKDSIIENSIITSNYDKSIVIQNSHIKNTGGLTGNCIIDKLEINQTPYIEINGKVFDSTICNKRMTKIKCKEVNNLHIDNDGEIDIEINKYENGKLNIKGNVLVESTLNIVGENNLEKFCELYGVCSLVDSTVTDNRIEKDIVIEKEVLDTVRIDSENLSNNKKYTIKVIDDYKRIVALRDIGGIIKKGDIGGIVQGYNSLDINDESWILPKAKVIYNAKVSGNSLIADECVISGNTRVINSIIRGRIRIASTSLIKNSQIKGKSDITGRFNIIDSEVKFKGILTITSDILNKKCIITDNK